MSFVPRRIEAPPRRRRPLDRDRIVAAGLELLDELGLEALTMRALADRLSVRAASLYRYVRNKDELLVLMADAVAGAPKPEPDLPWREQLVASARSQRRGMLSHPDFARLLAITSPAGPNRLGHIETRLKTLREAGFSDRDAAWGAYHLNNLVTEFVADEIRVLGSAKAAGTTLERFLADARTQLAALPADEFPHLRAASEHVAPGDLDALFGYGVDVWLDGLEGRMHKGRTSVRKASGRPV